MDRTSIGKAGAGIRWAVLMAAAGMAATAAQAQNLPITPGQRATAEQVYGVVVAEERPVVAGRCQYRLDEAASTQRRRTLGAV